MSIRQPPVAGLPHLPLAVDNQPGFRAEMLGAVSARAELAGLSTREVDDPTIGLLDAAAVLLDVLAFYGERIANENFLRPATERRSVLELARMIDYELAPGVAASTVLSFEVEPPPGAATDVVLPAGLPAQKLPGNDQRTAVYETSSELLARKDLNLLRPVVTRPWVPRFGDRIIVLTGIGLALTVGDVLLLVGDERQADSTNDNWDVRSIAAIQEFPADNGLDSDGAPARTVVTLDRPLGSTLPHVEPATKNARCIVLRTTGTLFGSAALNWTDLPLSLRVGELNPNPDATPRFLPGPYTAMKDSWVDAQLAASTTELWLDRVHQDVTTGSWLVLTGAKYTELYRVVLAEHGNRNAFLQSGPSTKVLISGENIERFAIRTAAMFAGGREIPLGSTPIAGPFTGRDITVNRPVDVPRGRLIAVSGTDADTGGPASEVLVVDVAAANPVTGTTVLSFTTALRHRYRPTGFRLRGNCVWATHGQTIRRQPIGSGDASRGFRTLPLAVGSNGPGPLTYTPAETPSGSVSSLDIRVDGVRWTEVDSLGGAAKDAQVYMVRHGEDASATVVFGDGVTGARPGSGRDNITAGYRVGLGLSGSAAVNQISLPLGLPLGTRSVLNPVPATGGEDPETLELARSNAPSTIRTLGRIVSVADIEDFARTFAGIGWASASEIDDGDRPLVHLTVTLADGSPLPAGSTPDVALRAAIDAARHRDRPIVIAGYLPRNVLLNATVRIDHRFATDDVLAAANSAVLALFDRRATLAGGGGFGMLITPTKVLGALQRTEGVLGAVLTALRPLDAEGDPVTAVRARLARVDGGTVRAAELLEPTAISVTEGARP